jgi:hypothetical protein
MDDPELHGDEMILIRTPGVRVKSIPFEAILTNKRIILVDRKKNLLPPKEIPLATIQAIEVGENAIRDSLITLAVVTKTKGTKQMVLTFSRESGGNRAKECNEWVQLIKENKTPYPERVIRKVIPAPDPTENAGPVSPKRFEIVGSPLPPTPDARYEQPAKPQPVKRVEAHPEVSWQAPAPVPSPAPAPAPTSDSILGIYCTRCGARVTEDSGFCNKCGSRIIRPTEIPQVPVVKPTPAAYVQTAKTEWPIDQERAYSEPPVERPSVTVPRDAQRTAPREPVPVPEQPAVAPEPVQPQKRFISRLDSPEDNFPPSRAPGLMPPANPRSRKKLVLAVVIVIIIIIAVVAVVVFLPNQGSPGSILPAFNSSGNSTTATPPAMINQAASIMTSVTEKVTISPS